MIDIAKLAESRRHLCNCGNHRSPRPGGSSKGLKLTDF